MRFLLTGLVLLTIVGAVGCTSTTHGAGQPAASSAGSRSPDFPSLVPNDTSSPVTPPASSTPKPPATPRPVAPTRRQREDRLSAQTNGEAHMLVAIPGGFEAATFDQQAHIQFWRSVGTAVAWTQVGTSTYPYSPAIGSPADAKVTGTLLTRMTHATFIVTGSFSGDSTGNAVAFTTGAKGWGVIKAEPNGNIGPSGQPVGSDRIGLSFAFAFSGGHLVTEDCRTDQALALCGSNPITKSWLWTGTDFSQV